MFRVMVMDTCPPRSPLLMLLVEQSTSSEISVVDKPISVRLSWMNFHTGSGSRRFSPRNSPRGTTYRRSLLVVPTCFTSCQNLQCDLSPFEILDDFLGHRPAQNL